MTDGDPYLDFITVSELIESVIAGRRALDDYVVISKKGLTKDQARQVVAAYEALIALGAVHPNTESNNITPAMAT